MYLLSRIKSIAKILTDHKYRKNYRRKQKLKTLSRSKHCLDLISKIKNVLSNNNDSIPVFIISFNNGVYVKNIALQFNKYDIVPIVIDNCSNNASTLTTLKELSDSGKISLVQSTKNFGYLVGFLDPIYAILPDIFAYTDPDLQLNQDLPADFLLRLADLTKLYHVYKAGFALNLLEKERITASTIKRTFSYPIFLERNFTVREWETQYWTKQLAHPELEVWSAIIDTTFAVYNKKNFLGNFYDAVRVGGNYSAIHLPWFPDLDLFSDKDRHAYSKGNVSSTWVK